MLRLLIIVFTLVLASCGDDGNNNGGDGCGGCVGVNIAGPGFPADPVVSCEPSGEFNCACVAESGQTATLSLEPGVGCIF
jgi:hypothetical protein